MDEALFWIPPAVPRAMTMYFTSVGRHPAVSTAAEERALKPGVE